MVLHQNHYNTIQYHYTLYVGRYTSFQYTHLFSRNQNPRTDSSVQCVHTAMMVFQNFYILQKINVSNMYEKQYTKRRSNSQSKLVVFYTQFEIIFFPIQYSCRICPSLLIDINKEAGTQNS